MVPTTETEIKSIKTYIYRLTFIENSRDCRVWDPNTNKLKSYIYTLIVKLYGCKKQLSSLFRILTEDV